MNPIRIIATDSIEKWVCFKLSISPSFFPAAFWSASGSGKIITNTKSTIDDLKDLRDQLNSVADNEVTTTQSSTPIEDVVSYDLDEGWIFNPETGQVEVAPGYSFDSEGNLVKVNIK